MGRDVVVSVYERPYRTLVTVRRCSKQKSGLMMRMVIHKQDMIYDVHGSENV